MSDEDHIPFHAAAISVSCPCRRWPTYYDAGNLRAFLLSRGWRPTLATVRERFKCKQCGSRPATRVVGALTNVSKLMPEKQKAVLGYESEGDRTGRRGAS